ncbi:protein SPT10 [Colletotrichum spaethianum]|uniref:Protein SPT10 n=1 Tax=Colletotrichum spaethianum TaxID=700344 RepID=A0AA37P0E5_9PEZI|nr:protein SPT10 [Colletotrichum spaethianum]GKT43433.1 protein SPT10 [Colletotrichum spaethianum]
MPAMLDDPASPTIYRVSGAPPFPDPNKPELPVDIVPRQVTLRDRQTIATIIPFASQHEVPQSLVRYLSDQLNKEIEGGDTYPMMDPMPADKFGAYWFQNFGAIMLLGNIERTDLADDMDWSRECLGSFYIKPNYPGRSSHVCNAGFLVTDASRNRGVGRLMGECYIDWAPKLGYTYSVFNLVYETNVASCKIWDALGFKRIGRVKGCGNLKSHPGQLIDAIIYGRDLIPGESEELVSEERFDKIKFYLKYGKYPAGADRAEKSRLRSAATHYKLLDGDRLMLKDKEVVPDPRRQYEIAREVHVAQHGGINKTTATIAEKYHWSRIKETVSDVIRNCAECKELGKMPAPGGNGGARGRAAAVAAAAAAVASSPANTSTSTSISNTSLSNPSFTNTSTSTPPPSAADVNTANRVLALQHHHLPPLSPPRSSPYAEVASIPPSHTLRDPSASPLPRHPHHNPMLQDESFQPIDPQIIGPPPTSHDDPYNHYHPHHTDFQALLNATEAEETAEEAAAVDRDLDMLIEQDKEEEDADEPMEGKEGRDKDVYSIGFING